MLTLKGEVQVGWGPHSHLTHLIAEYLPPTPGKPYSAPVRTVCNRRLSGLMDFEWLSPDEARGYLTCLTCIRRI
jgi:hypothetical protein